TSKNTVPTNMMAANSCRMSSAGYDMGMAVAGKRVYGIVDANRLMCLNIHKVNVFCPDAAMTARLYRSANIVEGPGPASNSSMYYGLGYADADFAKPMVGIANGHSTITPCNSGLQRLADAAAEAVRAAGGNPQVFGTPTISDGMSMGTEGMKYSLVSREVIADCVETCVQGQWMDGVLVIGGCDT